ncbi:Thioredoxin domain-containing protein 3 [Rhizoclosmatium sp. JEL0117]|nr:Thioredoxin domain-containing protein 3 [Rhizoclosmatium sp. JEL0117]
MAERKSHSLARKFLLLALVLVPVFVAVYVGTLQKQPAVSTTTNNVQENTLHTAALPDPTSYAQEDLNMAEGRGRAEVIALASTDEEFLALLSKPGVKIVDVYSKWAGHCEPMTAIFKRLKQEHGEKITYFRAVADTIDCLEKFRNQSCPNFMFFVNRVLVNIVRGANAPLIEKVIKEHVALELAGQPHPQVLLDEQTNPIATFLHADPSAIDSSHSAPAAESSHLPAAPIAPTSISHEVIESSPIVTEADSSSGPVEHTLAMLKPDAMAPGIIEEVMAILYHHRFEVHSVKKIWLSKEQAAELYKESEKMDYYDRLQDYISCAPVLVLDISKVNAIQAWRDVVGPRDPKDAKKDSPKSLRGMYGQDRLINTFHASDGPLSAARELAFIFQSDQQFTTLDFTPPSSPQASRGSGLPQKTLAVIKPNAMLKVDQIIAKIVARGYQVVKREELLLHTDRAQELSIEFLETPLFEESVNVLTSAPVLCMMLKGENVVEGWNEMLGPSDPEVARTMFPMSLRAQYGIDATNNGLHGSPTLQLAIDQLHSFFPHFLNHQASLNSIFKTPMASRTASLVGSKNNLATAALRASVTQLENQRKELAAAAAAISAENAFPPVERTLALIKPDVYPAKKDEIMEKIRADGFTVVVEREVQFDKEKAAEFYKEHLGKGFYEELTTWMSSAPIYAIVLEKSGAIKGWRALAGPTNSNKAREEHPESIRALFGTDGSLNAVHGSDSPASAAREIGVVFGSEVSPTPDLQRTLALIKPDVYPAKKDEIVARIKQAGFTIVKESEVSFDKEKAAEFYKEHEGKGFYEELTTWMSSAPIYALVLEKPAAIKEWRNLAGPTNSNKARETAPHSIRALFGTDGSLNAVHGSDSPTSAEREIGVVFGGEVAGVPPPVLNKETANPLSKAASRAASGKPMEADAPPAADI